MAAEDYNSGGMIGGKIGIPELVVLLILFPGLVDFLLTIAGAAVIGWRSFSYYSGP